MVSRQRLDLPGATTGVQRRVQRQERSAPLGFSSITRGGLRVQSADGIQVRTVAGGAPGMRVTGLQVVDGTLRITGTLEGGGTWTWTGALTQTGTTNLNGPWNMNGAGTIAGNVTQTGNTSMTGNFTVAAGGKITVGSMTIDPSISGGAITFANGAQVFTDASTIQVFKGNSVMQVSNDYARIQYGGSVVEISANGIRTTGVGTKTLASTPGAFVGAMVYDGGYMKRVV